MVSNFSVRLFFISIFSALVFSACTRVSTSELGLGLLPSIDAFNTKDTTLDVITETVDRPDSTRVYGTDDHIIGSITDDPAFGTTNASMFFQMKPSFFPFFIAGSKDSLVVDSAILILAYKGFYGDTTKPVKIQLKRISAATPLEINKNRNLDALLSAFCYYDVVLTRLDLERIKNFFDNFKGNHKDPEYILNGGVIMRNWVNDELRKMRDTIKNNKQNIIKIKVFL